MSSSISNMKDKLKQQSIEYEKRLIFDSAELLKVMSKEIGKEKTAEIFLKMRSKIVANWGLENAKKHLEKGRENNIEGILEFVWNLSQEQGIEFTYDVKKDGSYQFKVTKCPYAIWAREMGIEEWTYLYHCMADYSITEGYNKNIGFKRSKTLMQGDDYCDHCYFWKK